MEVERRMWFLASENSMTRNDSVVFTFPGHPRCNSIPSCRVSMLRGIHLRSSLHLLSKLAAQEACAKDTDPCSVQGDDTIWNMSGQLCSGPVGFSSTLVELAALSVLSNCAAAAW